MLCLRKRASGNVEATPLLVFNRRGVVDAGERKRNRPRKRKGNRDVSRRRLLFIASQSALAAERTPALIVVFDPGDRAAGGGARRRRDHGGSDGREEQEGRSPGASASAGTGLSPRSEDRYELRVNSQQRPDDVVEERSSESLRGRGVAFQQLLCSRVRNLQQYGSLAQNRL